MNVFDSRVNTQGHVPASVQGLQAKRVIPVELSVGGEEKHASAGRRSFTRAPVFLCTTLALMFVTYVLIPHFHHILSVVIETKVAG